MPAAKSDLANATTNLSTVIAAVGPQIFSFFPLGSLINGHRSPLLVSTIFHDSVFLCLGQSETLNLSSCPHLRKLSDKSLIRLIRNIVEICGAHHPEYPRYVERRRVHNCSGMEGCPCPIKAVHLDLSRCRFLKREGVYFALKHVC